MKYLKSALMSGMIGFLISCDKGVGEDGVVQNAITHELLENVTVHMHSLDHGDRSDITDENGYFNVYKSFSCGIASCNTDYTIKFNIEGYEPLTIRETYWKEAEYLDPETKDTMIVRLVPLD